MGILVDATFRQSMSSFMDYFSGYKHTKIDPYNAGKTAFQTLIGKFHYTIMPFGLKITGVN